MSDWKNWAARVTGGADERLDALRLRLRRRFGYGDPLRITPYRSYGTTQALFLRGRVLEDEDLAVAGEHDSAWRHLLSMYKRLESDEVPGARVRARAGSHAAEAVTDEEGYFEIRLDQSGPPSPRLWHEVELELLEPRVETEVRATGQVLVPPPTARFGVISDIDDTVMWTNTADKLRMARLVFLNNVRTRLPFKGVAAFYRALQAGAGGAEQNPIFYVSSSPWNLYDLLEEFFELHGLPPGPILLRDIGITRHALYAEGHEGHKLARIAPILERYPQLPFILIGDTSQKDPEIYREVVRAYPQRVLAVYIRNVSPDPTRQEAVNLLIEEVREAGSQLVLAQDSLFAATHAAGEGWIAAGAVGEVRDEKRTDERAPSPAEGTGSPP